VAQIFVQKGQWVNAGEPIARIIDLKNLRVQAAFDKDYILRIKEGNSATFSYKIGDESFVVPVKITYVDKEIIRGLVQVWAEVDNSAGKYIPGVEGKLTVQLNAKSGEKTDPVLEVESEPVLPINSDDS